MSCISHDNNTFHDIGLLIDILLVYSLGRVEFTSDLYSVLKFKACTLYYVNEIVALSLPQIYIISKGSEQNDKTELQVEKVYPV